MTKIKADFETIRQCNYRLKNMADALNCSSSDIINIIGNLDWEIRYKGNVMELLYHASNTARKLAEESCTLSEYLSNTEQRLKESDEQCKSSIEQMTMRIPSDRKIHFNTAGAIFIGAVTIPGTSGLPWIKQCIPIRNRADAMQHLTDDFEYNYANLVNSTEERIKKLKETMDKEGYKVGTVSTRGGHCNGFASDVFEKMFGVKIRNKQILDGTMNEKNNYYRLNIGAEDKIDIIPGGKFISKGSVTKEDVVDLFANAKPGDFVQMKWFEAGTPHSAIFMGIEDGSIEFYDANWDLNNGIQKHKITLEKYAEYISKAGNGVTIYTPSLK